jgi:hypothetical protein
MIYERIQSHYLIEVIQYTLLSHLNNENANINTIQEKFKERLDSKFTLEELQIVSAKHLFAREPQTKPVLITMFLEHCQVRIPIPTTQNEVAAIRSHLDTIITKFSPLPRAVNKYNIVSVLQLPTVPLEESFQECGICIESVNRKNMVHLNCNHLFCGTCINQSIKSQYDPEKNPTCAFCRGTITTFTTQNKETFDLVSECCEL